MSELTSSVFDLSTTLSVWRKRIFADLRVAFPASVQSFDAQKGTVDVQPLIREAVEQEDGSVAYMKQSVIPSVPVVFPGGGGLRIAFPLQAGDTGLCVVTDRTLDQWGSGGGSDVNQDDPRMHDQSDAVFYPGLKAATAWQGNETGVITIGSDAGTANFVALSNKVDDALSSIRTVFNAHTHAPASPPGTPITALPTTASTTVKIKG